VPKVSKSALVNFSANDMFEIVDNVALYPEFLPWCGSTEVISRSSDTLEASIEIAHGGINKTFSTRNRMQKGKMIELQLLNGPFHSLHGFWRFDALGENACKVSLDLNYEFSSKILGLVVGPVFNKIANTLVDAFCERAGKIYG